jgi:hypothetical protein
MSRRYSYKGYVIERGDYVGTPSDRVDGWYLALKGSTVVDHRGRGFRTIADAKREVDLISTSTYRRERILNRLEALADEMNG